MSTVTQILYFTLKESVVPESPTNDPGRLFSEVVCAARCLFGYIKSCWSRTLEKENDIVWIIEWKETERPEDNIRRFPMCLITSCLEFETMVFPYYATFTPSLSVNLLEAPVLEIKLLLFPRELDSADTSRLWDNLFHFRTECLHLTGCAPATGMSIGSVRWPDTTYTAPVDTGPRQARMVVILTGWGSRAEQGAAEKSEQFRNAMEPLKAMMLPADPFLRPRHIQIRWPDSPERQIPEMESSESSESEDPGTETLPN